MAAVDSQIPTTANVAPKEGKPANKNKQRRERSRLVDDEEAANEVLGMQKEVVKAKRSQMVQRQRLDELDDSRREFSDDIEMLVKELGPLREEKNSAMADLQAVRGNTTWMKDAQSLQTRKKALPFTKVADLEHALTKIEMRMAHETLTIKEEKQLMEQIRKLKSVAKEVEAFERDNEQISTQRSEFRRVSEEVAPQTERFNALKQIVARKSDEINTLREKRAVVEAERQELRKEVDGQRKAMDVQFKRVRALQTEAPSKVRGFFLAVQEVDEEMQMAQFNRQMQIAARLAGLSDEETEDEAKPVARRGDVERDEAAEGRRKQQETEMKHREERQREEKRQQELENALKKEARELAEVKAREEALVLEKERQRIVAEEKKREAEMEEQLLTEYKRKKQAEKERARRDRKKEQTKIAKAVKAEKLAEEQEQAPVVRQRSSSKKEEVVEELSEEEVVARASKKRAGGRSGKSKGKKGQPAAAASTQAGAVTIEPHLFKFATDFLVIGAVFLALAFYIYG